MSIFSATMSSSNESFNASFASDHAMDATFGNSIVLSHDYEELYNKPKINSVELTGDKSFDDLGMQALTNIEINNILR